MPDGPCVSTPVLDWVWTHANLWFCNTINSDPTYIVVDDKDYRIRVYNSTTMIATELILAVRDLSRAES